MSAVNERTRAEIERQGFTLDDRGLYVASTFFCLASWHPIDIVSHAYGEPECGECQEPCVSVWLRGEDAT